MSITDRGVLKKDYKRRLHLNRNGDEFDERVKPKKSIRKGKDRRKEKKCLTLQPSILKIRNHIRGRRKRGNKIQYRKDFDSILDISKTEYQGKTKRSNVPDPSEFEITSSRSAPPEHLCPLPEVEVKDSVTQSPPRTFTQSLYESPLLVLLETGSSYGTRDWL